MCNCVEQINAALKDKNVEIVQLLDIRTGRFLGVYIHTDWIVRKRGDAPTMIATYCPFCGQKYQPADGAQ